MSKTALITGISGQDGSYLAELLLSKGYSVHGIIRRSSSINTKRIDHIFDPESKAYLHFGQLGDDLSGLIYEIKPDEIYNLGSMSHVRVSFDIPIYTAHVTGVAVLNLLESIRRGIKIGALKKDTKFYQASSSEMFGITPPPQSETTLFQPVSPYGCAKLFGYHIVKTYRKGYDMFASNGILFNHESERRGETFVTRKITKAATRIKLGLQEKLILGNLNALRDWGHSKDYMEAIWRILQHDKPDDFVVSTGEYHSIREFLEKVFAYLELDINKYVTYDKSFERPNEVPALLGNSDKIRKTLGWEPKILFDNLVQLMIESDMKLAEQELKLKG